MEIFNASIVGYKNKIKRSQSQDYIDYKFIDSGVVCAVADGHSTDYFKYSDIGAKYACQAAIEVLKNIECSIETISEMLKNLEIQRNIYNLWMKMVEDHYRKNNPVVYKTEYLKYSTTLIAALITNDYHIYLKLGDGGIVEKNNNQFRKILDLPLKPIVDSLGREDAFINIAYDIRLVRENKCKSRWIMIFTDGYENSYHSEEMLFSSLQTTISKYNSNIFSKSRLKNNYKNYLSKLSKEVTHDDISIMFIGL